MLPEFALVNVIEGLRGEFSPEAGITCSIGGRLPWGEVVRVVLNPTKVRWV